MGTGLTLQLSYRSEELKSRTLQVQKSFKYSLVTLTVVLFLFSCANSESTSANRKNSGKQVINYEKSDADYLELVQRLANKTATEEDVDKVLRLYPLTSFYSPNDPVEERTKELSKAFIVAKEWVFCLRENIKVLNQNFMSFTAHYGMAVCSQEAGDQQTAQYHNWVLDKFIEATWRSGDGQSLQTPFYINSTQDLIAFIQLHQMVIVEQRLIYRDQVPIQKVRVQNPENRREYDWFFDMTPQFRKAYIESIERG